MSQLRSAKGESECCGLFHRYGTRWPGLLVDYSQSRSPCMRILWKSIVDRHGPRANDTSASPKGRIACPRRHSDASGGTGTDSKAACFLSESGRIDSFPVGD